MSQDLLIKILGQLGEVSERTARIETKVGIIEHDVARIKEEDAQQNKLLDEHIAGVETNRQRLDIEIKNRQDIEKRIASLETFPKGLAMIKTIAMWFGAVLGPISVIIGIFYTISKF